MALSMRARDFLLDSKKWPTPDPRLSGKTIPYISSGRPYDEPIEAYDLRMSLPKDSDGKPIYNKYIDSGNPKLKILQKWNGSKNYIINDEVVGSYLTDGPVAPDTKVRGGEWIWNSDPELIGKEEQFISKKMGPGFKMYKPNYVSKEVFSQMLQHALEDL